MNNKIIQNLRSFSSLVWELSKAGTLIVLIIVIVLGMFVLFIWVPNMIRIDRSLSRFEEHDEYKKKTASIIPFIF